MLLKDNRYAVLKVFLFSPTESFRLRELGRLSGLSPPAVMRYLKEFEGTLVVRYEKRGVPYYKALRDEPDFKLYLKLSIILELNLSGLVDYLWDKVAPDAILLYGSASRGESTEESDIDIFLAGAEAATDVNEFETKLGKRIHLLAEKSPENLPQEFRNNLANGIVLKGYLTLIKNDNKFNSGQEQGKINPPISRRKRSVHKHH